MVKDHSIKHNKLLSTLNKDGKEFSRAELLNDVIAHAPYQVREQLGVQYRKDAQGNFELDEHGKKIAKPYFKPDGGFAQVAEKASMLEEVNDQLFIALVQRIGPVILRLLSFKNPYYIFQRQNIDYGKTLQEIIIAPVKPRQFDARNEENPYRRFPSDVRAMYHQINHEWQYPITAEEAWTKKDFVDATAFDNFTNGLVRTLITSANLQRKADVLAQVTAGFIPKNVHAEDQPPLFTRVPSSFLDPDLDNFAHNFQSQLISRTSLIANPAWTHFEAAVDLPSATPIEEQILLINSQMMAEYKLEIATLYNKEYGEFASNVVPVDVFPVYEGDDEYNGAQPVATITSREQLFVLPKLYKMQYNTNISTMSQNFMLNDHYLAGHSRFMPAHIYFIFPLLVEFDNPSSIINGSTVNAKVKFINNGVAPYNITREIKINGNGKISNLKATSDSGTVTVDGNTITINGAIKHEEKGQIYGLGPNHIENVTISFDTDAKNPDLSTYIIEVTKPARDSHGEKATATIVGTAVEASNIVTNVVSDASVVAGNPITVGVTLNNTGESAYTTDRTITVDIASGVIAAIDTDSVKSSVGTATVKDNVITVKGDIDGGVNETIDFNIKTEATSEAGDIRIDLSKPTGNTSGKLESTTSVTKPALKK